TLFIPCTTPFRSSHDARAAHLRFEALEVAERQVLDARLARESAPEELPHPRRRDEADAVLPDGEKLAQARLQVLEERIAGDRQVLAPEHEEPCIRFCFCFLAV